MPYLIKIVDQPLGVLVERHNVRHPITGNRMRDVLVPKGTVGGKDNMVSALARLKSTKDVQVKSVCSGIAEVLVVTTKSFKELEAWMYRTRAAIGFIGLEAL